MAIFVPRSSVKQYPIISKCYIYNIEYAFRGNVQLMGINVKKMCTNEELYCTSGFHNFAILKFSNTYTNASIFSFVSSTSLALLSRSASAYTATADDCMAGFIYRLATSMSDCGEVSSTLSRKF